VQLSSLKFHITAAYCPLTLTQARIKPALGRLLQEVRCATLLLHENRLARFAYLKRLSATLPQITQTGELIVKVTLHGKIPPFSRAYRAN
jgi:hypothetical protein